MQGRSIRILPALVACGIAGLVILVGCGGATGRETTPTSEVLTKGTASGTVPLVLTVRANGTPTEDVKPKTPALRNPGEPGRSFPGAQPGATMPLASPGYIVPAGTPGTPDTPGTPGTPTR